MSFRRKFSLGCLGLAVLLFLYATEEHFRGKWALERWKQEMRAKGEKFEIAELIPPAVPDKENAYYDLVDASKRIQQDRGYPRLAPPTLRLVAPGKAVVTRELSQWKVDESTRQRFGITYATWDQFNQNLQQIRTPLDAVKAALAKPNFNAYPNYAAGSELGLSHLAETRRPGQFLAAAVASDLHAGENSLALDDLLALVGLSNCLRDEPLSYSQKMRFWIFQIAVDTAWQTLQATGWKDSDLEMLQHATACVEFLRPMARALEMERAMRLREYRQARAELTTGVEQLLIGSSSDFTLRFHWTRLTRFPPRNAQPKNLQTVSPGL